jgi:hypothetical protein
MQRTPSSTIRHALRVVTVWLGLFGGLLVAAEDSGAETPAPRLTTTGLSPGQTQLLGWALGLFDAADLALPPLHVAAHDTTEACHGRIGAHDFTDGRSTIHLCTRDAGPAEEFLYLHELAHAWDHHALDESRRRAFLELRGLTDWNNRDPDGWHARGAEHAAEIVTWALMDRPVAVVRLRQNSCADLKAGYITLTGRPPLHGYEERCDDEATGQAAVVSRPLR